MTAAEFRRAVSERGGQPMPWEILCVLKLLFPEHFPHSGAFNQLPGGVFKNSGAFNHPLCGVWHSDFHKVQVRGQSFQGLSLMFKVLGFRMEVFSFNMFFDSDIFSKNAQTQFTKKKFLKRRKNSLNGPVARHEEAEPVDERVEGHRRDYIVQAR